MIFVHVQVVQSLKICLKTSITQKRGFEALFGNHSAANFVSYLTHSECKIIKQRPYLPDLNACDAFLFAKLKDHVRGMAFFNE